MQAVVTQIHRANMKAILISRMNLILVALDGIAMIMLIATWAVSVSKEDEGLSARYAAGIIAFVFLAVTMVLAVLVQKLQPRLSLFYAHEVFAVLTLILMALTMGMNNSYVDLCNRKTQTGNVQCGAHIAELIAELLVCITMAVSFGSTQQRIVTYIDKGILDGIKGRSNGGMTQLP